MKKGILFIILICLISFASAASFEYSIIEKETLTKIDLSKSEFDLLDLPTDIKLTDLVEGDNGYFEFISPSFISKSGKDSFFVVSNTLHKGASISVNLPKGATISEDYFVFPKGYEMETNGQNIIVSWDSSPEKEILIPYNDNKKSFSWVWITLILVIGTLGAWGLGVLVLQKKKNYSRNLFREEKQIVDYLHKKGDSWTKELVRDLQISKVKLSRKLRNLEEKGLIKREPHGNENRIKLLK